MAISKAPDGVTRLLQGGWPLSFRLHLPSEGLCGHVASILAAPWTVMVPGQGWSGSAW